MDTVRTGNTRLMRAGDECVFINNVDMCPEYHITTGKEYPGVIHSVRVDYSVKSNILNDVGEPVTQETSFGSFNGGYSNVNSVLPREEYIDRVNKLHAVNVTKIMEQTTASLNGSIDLRNKMLEVANVTASV